MNAPNCRRTSVRRDERNPPRSHQQKRTSLLPSRTRLWSGNRLKRMHGSVSAARRPRRRQPGRGSGHAVREGIDKAQAALDTAEEKHTQRVAVCVPRGHREEGPSRGCELGCGSETVEGGRAAGRELRNAAQECVANHDSSPKKFFADLSNFFLISKFFRRPPGVRTRKSRIRSNAFRKVHLPVVDRAFIQNEPNFCPWPVDPDFQAGHPWFREADLGTASNTAERLLVGNAASKLINAVATIGARHLCRHACGPQRLRRVRPCRRGSRSCPLLPRIAA